jgi:voltage-gated potassium channel
MPTPQHERLSPFREKIHEIIFEADTPIGKAFDIGLIVLILFSVLIVMLESIGDLQVRYSRVLNTIEYITTAIFTIEYLLRLYVVRSPMKYARSFFGIIDVLAILPAYLTYFFAGTHFLVVIRALRLMRIFRIFKLGHFMKEGSVIVDAMKSSRTKITIFLFFILILVTIVGSIMYVIEGETNESFTSIPRSIYWAIVTMTTVGYGDIAPQTAIGQFFSAAVMILGYAVIAVPTGIVSSELMKEASASTNTQACLNCGEDGHDDNANYCKLCGEDLYPKRRRA